ncbi:hypothetical protein AAD018_014755 [Aestuariibius insulae]|uniref:hypothetical protein n=1 Tax=Aestuariibius insulae TaxID=2058287 RepID=UPI00345EC229
MRHLIFFAIIGAVVFGLIWAQQNTDLMQRAQTVAGVVDESGERVERPSLMSRVLGIFEPKAEDQMLAPLPEVEGWTRVAIAEPFAATDFAMDGTTVPKEGWLDAAPEDVDRTAALADQEKRIMMALRSGEHRSGAVYRSGDATFFVMVRRDPRDKVELHMIGTAPPPEVVDRPSNFVAVEREAPAPLEIGGAPVVEDNDQVGTGEIGMIRMTVPFGEGAVLSLWGAGPRDRAIELIETSGILDDPAFALPPEDGA